MEVKNLEQLQQENIELTQKVADLEAELEVTKSVNEELTAKVEELASSKTLAEAGSKAQDEPKPILPTDTFDVDGQKYKFISPVFVHNKMKVYAIQAIKDTALLSELVAKGSGVITKA